MTGKVVTTHIQMQIQIFYREHSKMTSRKKSGGGSPFCDTMYEDVKQ